MSRSLTKRAEMSAENVSVSTIEKAISSKSWASRKDGYETVATVLKNLEPHSPNWEKLSFLIQAISEERNIPALEKGLELALMFVQMCANMKDEVVTALLDSLVKRALANQKNRIRELASQICMVLLEKNKHELVITMLLDGLEGKNAKQAFACIRTIKSALVLFGPKVINVPLITRRVASLCVDKSFFQQEVKDLLVQIYAFVGASIREDLNELDASQLKTMDIEFVKVHQGGKVSAVSKQDCGQQRPTSARPKSTRGMKNQLVSQISQQRQISARRVEGNAADRVTSPRAEGRISSGKRREAGGACGDRYSPRNRNIRARSAQTHVGFDDIFTLIESKQWGDRKDALEGLLKEINSDKVVGHTSYNRTIKCLRNVILNDTNVLLISKAVNCVTALAKKEDEEFRQHAPLMMTLLLEKFKEKKSVLVEALREATDTIYSTSNFATIVRYISLSLEHQNPAVKSETELFVCRCFSNPSSDILKPIYWQQLVGNLVKNLGYQDQNVRQYAAKALGVMMRAVGENNLSPYLSAVNKHHMNMILSYSNEAVIEYRHSNSYMENYQSDESLDMNDSFHDDIGVKNTGRDDVFVYSSEELSLNSQGKLERLYYGREPTQSSLSKLSKGSSVRSTNLTKPNELNLSRGSTRYELTKSPGNPQILTAMTKEFGAESSESRKGSSRSERRTKQLSAAAQQKLDALRSTIQHLKTAKGSVEQEIARKLDILESNVDTCVDEIRALSPLLYEEMTKPSTHNSDSSMVLREFNKKLVRIGGRLKSVNFDENISNLNSGVTLSPIVIRQGRGNWFMEVDG